MKDALAGCDPTAWYLERRDRIKVINLIKENKLLASPDLLEVYYDFRNNFYEEGRDEEEALDWKMLNVADDEYDKLKLTLGYGKIVKRGVISRTSVRLYSLGWGATIGRFKTWQRKSRKTRC